MVQSVQILSRGGGGLGLGGRGGTIGGRIYHRGCGRLNATGMKQGAAGFTASGHRAPGHRGPADNSGSGLMAQQA